MIHRYWTGDQHPPEYSQWIRRVIRKTQGEDAVDWDDHSLPVDILAVADKAETARGRANHVRLNLLWQHGGLWLDHDIVPLAMLHAPFDYVPLVAAHQDGTLCPAVMMFRPEDELIKAAMMALKGDESLAAVISDLWRHEPIITTPHPVENDGTVEFRSYPMFLEIGK